MLSKGWAGLSKYEPYPESARTGDTNLEDEAA